MSLKKLTGVFSVILPLRSRFALSAKRHIQNHHQVGRITLQGALAAMTPAGMSWGTTLPAPITEPASSVFVQDSIRDMAVTAVFGVPFQMVLDAPQRSGHNLSAAALPA